MGDRSPRARSRSQQQPLIPAALARPRREAEEGRRWEAKRVIGFSRAPQVNRAVRSNGPKRAGASWGYKRCAWELEMFFSVPRGNSVIHTCTLDIFLFVYMYYIFSNIVE